MDIDVVVTWVNSTCTQWQHLYEKFVGKAFKTTERFTISNDPECELAICLQCIRKKHEMGSQNFCTHSGWADSKVSSGRNSSTPFSTRSDTSFQFSCN